MLRDQGALVLADGTQVDAVTFEREAERALAAPTGAEARAWAQAALGRYTGELLPDHRYEEWAAGPRERLRGLALRLVDLLADRAQAEGELDDALRLLEQGIELDPLDERRRLDVARILLQQGQEGPRARGAAPGGGGAARNRDRAVRGAPGARARHTFVSRAAWDGRGTARP